MDRITRRVDVVALDFNKILHILSFRKDAKIIPNNSRAKEIHS